MIKDHINSRKIHITENSKRLIAFMLVVFLLISQSGCASKAPEVVNEPKGIEPITIEREAEPQALQTAGAATALALRHYIYARLKTEELLSADLSSMEDQDRIDLIDQAVLAWETADVFTSGAQNVVDQAISVIERPQAKKTSTTNEFSAKLFLSALRGTTAVAAPLAVVTGRQIDPQTWAENLTKQYDAISGAKKYKQLADQLGIDTKKAIEQMALAQKIIHNAASLEEAEAEVKELTKSVNIVQGYKTASKVGLFIGATIATAGGASAIGGSSLTLGQAGGVIVSGTDAIVDVAATGSNIILGEDHQVSVGFDDVKNKLAPVTAILGLANLSTTIDQDNISYIGESLVDLFYEGKILGIKMIATKGGTIKLNVTATDVKNAGEAAIKTALEAAELLIPGSKETTLERIMGGYELPKEESIEKLEALVSQMAEIIKAAETILAENSAVVSPDAPATTDASSESGIPKGSEILGKYVQTILSVQRSDGTMSGDKKNEYEMKKNDDGTFYWEYNVVSTDQFGSYNESTGELSIEGEIYVRLYSAGDTVKGEGHYIAWGEKTLFFTLEKIAD